MCTGSLKLSLTTGEMKVLFDHIDMDDSNTVTEAEFVDFLKKDAGDIFRSR
jgi:hypothetical protein